jgi:hypothetical protein
VSATGRARTSVYVTAIVWAVSFFLPAAVESISGYQAFWMSLTGWRSPGEWDLESVPLLLAWLANVGAVSALTLLLGSARRLLRTRSALAGLGVLALGPPVVALRDLRVGYYLWALAILGLTWLALREVRGAVARRG